MQHTYSGVAITIYVASAQYNRKRDRSPFRPTLYPSRMRPLEMSHRGDSGKKVRHITMIAGGRIPIPSITLHLSHTCGTSSWHANPEM